jgi:hypothetical protein
MKPISHHPSKKAFSRHDCGAGRRPQPFPGTDYYFHATVEAAENSYGGRRKLALADLRAFRKISSEFLAAETHREYAAEAALFALVGALAAWPVILMLIVLAQTARG